MVILASVMSCSSDTSFNYLIDLSKVNIIEKTTGLASRYFKEVKTISFNDSFKLGDPYKIRLVANKLFILDELKLKIFVSDTNGIITNILNRAGEGPGNYNEISDFDIDDNGYIYILDINKSTLFKYTQNGHCLAQKRITDYPYRIIIYNNNIYVYTGLNSRGKYGNCMFTVYDNQLMKKSNREVGCHNIKDYDHFNNIEYGPISIYKYNNALRIWEFCYNDNIYQLNSERNELEVVNGFLYKDSPPLELRKEAFFFENRVASNFIYELFEYTDYFVFNGMDEEFHQFKFLIDKTSGEVHNNKFHFDIIDHGLIDDFDGRWPIWPRFRLNDSVSFDYYYGSHLKEKIKHPGYLKSDTLTGKSELTDEIFEIENPIIRILYFRPAEI